MSLQRLVINTGDLTAAGFKSVCDLSPGDLPAVQNLENYIGSLSGGLQSALLEAKVGAVQSAGILTVSSTGSTAAQACTILNVTLTGVASAPAANEFVVSSTPAVQAANMIAAINASASLTGKVVASAGSTGQVVITSVVPGVMGNGLQLSAGNLGNVVLTAFTGGSDGTSYSLDLR